MIKEFKGKVFSKIERIGSRSEGPEYFLKLLKPNELNQIDLPIRKNAGLWQEDPNLHQFLGKMVIITGESIRIKHVSSDGTLKSESIAYKEIKEIKK